jgi:hypothetical protein
MLKVKEYCVNFVKRHFMDSPLEQELVSYFTRLNEDEKKSVIQLLKSFLQGRKEKDARITLEEYNKEVDEALEQAQKGEFITQEELEIRASKW